MTREEIADLLQQAAVRLSQSYFEEVERERDSRWGGDVEQADKFRDEADELRALVEECRRVAARLLEDGITLRVPVRQRDTNSRVLNT